MSGLGLFGTLEMGKNSLAASRTAAEITGHNLANASNPAYARQRVRLESAATLPTTEGPQGMGARVAGFEQIRDKQLDKYLVSEKYLTGYYGSKLQTLHHAEARLGQIIDRQTVDPKSGSLESTGLAERVTDFFNTFQALSAAPTSNAERRLTVVSGEELADRIHRAHDRLSTLRSDVNNELKDTVAEVNKLLTSISKVSQKISSSETEDTGLANELRDQRQATFEELAKYVNFAYTESSNNKLGLTIAGQNFIVEDALSDKLQTVDISATDPNPIRAGMTYINSTNDSSELAITGGKIKGLIDARDETIYKLMKEVNDVAKEIISEVNTLHKTGFDLYGNNNNTLTFFTGTGAANIAVNATLTATPQRIQASAYANEPGDNTIAKQIAGLAQKSITNLNNVTFSESYANSVAQFGQTIASTETQLEAQESVE